MKKMKMFFILMLVGVVLSGCIIYVSPDPEETLTLSPGEVQLFLTVGTKAPFLGNSTLYYEWFVDNVLVETDSPSFFYSPGILDLGQHTIKCIVEVRNDKTDLLLWSDTVEWSVNVQIL